MLKPIRVSGTEKSRIFNDKLKNGLEHAINFILGTNGMEKVLISEFDLFLMPIETYLKAYKKKSILLKIFAENAFTGELYWFFELRTAITLGSLMRMMQESNIQDRLKTDVFDEMDQDSFGEIGNQLCGILDRAFRNLTSKNIHLKMDFKKSVFPNDSIQSSMFLQEEEYVVFLAGIRIPKFTDQKLTLLLPRSLYERLLNIELSLEGIAPKHLLVYSTDPARIANLEMKLTSRQVKVKSVDALDEILNNIDKYAVSAIGLEIKRPIFPLPHADTILFKRLAANPRFSRIPYFLTWPGIREEEIATLARLGLKAVKGDFLMEFPLWSQAFTS